MRTRLLLAAVVVTLVAAACLRIPATRAGLSFGYAVDPAALADDAAYAGAVAADAGVVTPENHMKWSLVHPAPGTYDFAAADSIVASAAAQGQHVRGHVLVWHRQLPAWLTEREWTRAELVDVLRDHVHTVVGHFRDEFPGVVRQWDVVNEAFHADGTRRSTIWQDVIGDDYLELAFRFAHEADPDAQLFYNDFYDHGLVAAEAALEGLPSGVGATAGRSSCDDVPKCTATRSLVEGLVARDVPIHGVGFQGHVLGTAPADYRELASWVEPLGLSWAVTELDVALLTAQGSDPVALDAQADAYESIVTDCLESDACDTVVVWGVDDAHSWIPGTTGGLLGHATLRDAQGVPKPAYVRLLGLLAADDLEQGPTAGSSVGDTFG